MIWNAVSTITVARTPKGDYAKALRALRSRPAPRRRRGPGPLITAGTAWCPTFRTQ